MFKFKGDSCSMTDQKTGMVKDEPTAIYFGSQVYPFNVGYLELCNMFIFWALTTINEETHCKGHVYSSRSGWGDSHPSAWSPSVALCWDCSQDKCYGLHVPDFSHTERSL